MSNIGLFDRAAAGLVSVQYFYNIQYIDLWICFAAGFCTDIQTHGVDTGCWSKSCIIKRYIYSCNNIWIEAMNSCGWMLLEWWFWLWITRNLVHEFAPKDGHVKNTLTVLENCKLLWTIPFVKPHCPVKQTTLWK